MPILIQVRVNMNKKTIAIIVSTQPYKEKDALVRMISEQGESLTMVAKGVASSTSKYSAYLQPFQVCEIDYFHKEPISTFISASIKQRFEWSSLHDMAAASFIVQSMEAINSIEPRAFTLVDVLTYYHIIEHHYMLALLKFCFELFKRDGRQLVVDECVDCGSLQVSGFSLSAGGFCCKNCALHERIDVKDIDVLKTFRCVAKAPLELTVKCNSSAVSMAEIQLFVHDLKESYPLSMKSWKFMDELV